MPGILSCAYNRMLFHISASSALGSMATGAVVVFTTGSGFGSGFGSGSGSGFGLKDGAVAIAAAF